ncbi:MAG: PAS domain S-box protein [Spirulinaceae cyanobacterium RM2_2_10]|nr:PAS domain S-box protein [Spirulinaceae cyanobacterium RM2_2_10]
MPANSQDGAAIVTQFFTNNQCQTFPSPHLLWRAAANGQIVALGTGWQDDCGDRSQGDRDPETRFWQAIDPDERQDARQQWQAAVQIGSSFDYEVTLSDAHGDHIRVWLHAERATDTEWLGTATLLASVPKPVDHYLEQQFFRTLLNNLSDGIVACDRQGQIVFCNHTARDFLGLADTPPTLEAWAQACHLYPSGSGAPLPFGERPFQRLLRGDSLHNLELRAISATGQVRDLLASGDPIMAEAGDCLGAVIALRDISQHKQAEAEVLRLNSQLAQKLDAGTMQLAAISRLYRSVLQSIGEVIFQTDVAGRWTFLSSPWTTITGYKVDECLGRSFLEWVFADEDRLILAQQFHALVEGDREIIEHEFRSLTHEGGLRWLEIYMRLEMDQDGKVLGALGQSTTSQTASRRRRC